MSGINQQAMLPIGTVVGGRYRITRYLSSGGFGNTYEAEHTDLGTRCALKEYFIDGMTHRGVDGLSVEVSNSQNLDIYNSQLDKFRQEARLLNQMKHPGIVRVHDLFVDNQTAYYAMDIIDGESLASILKKNGALSEEKALNYIRQVLEALAYVHSKGLLHLDIKPGNIMIDRATDRAILIDFGATKQMEQSGNGFSTTAPAYTKGYAPAEQINYNKVKIGPWSDLYAVGATLFNLTTNDFPPLSDDITDYEEGAFKFADDASPEFRSLVVWLMQQPTKKRPQSVAEVLARINGESIATPPKPIPPIITPSPSPVYQEPHIKEYVVKGVSFMMVRVPGGTFTMGATAEQGRDADSDERPTRSVTLSSYLIGQTEVTQELWQAVMGSNPSYFKGANLPVEQVGWDDCQTFITRLNQLTGERFRLPTEAEWEYAARGGQSGGAKYSGSDNLGEVAWYSDNSSSKTHPVATKKPNRLGIYDMSGNVWEWCYDWYGGYSSSSQTDPKGPSSGSYRVLRGGSWGDSARYCRVASRGNAYQVLRYYYGSRLALVHQ